MMHGLHKFLLFHVLACLGPNALGSEIINGEKATENSMLYMASVQDKKQHVCGGFLVSKDFVITAAQCDVNVETAMVVVGTHNLNLVRKNVKYIVKKCKHPSYNKNGWNDIMLLKLGGDDRYNIRVQTIPLPSPGMNIKEKEKCRVAGWGSTKTGGKFESDLRVVNVSVINMTLCKRKLSGLPSNVICTDKGFCKGDSGGPLVCNGTAVGVASFNKRTKCNYPGEPNVYTDISKYLNWIKEVLNKNNC